MYFNKNYKLEIHYKFISFYKLQILKKNSYFDNKYNLISFKNSLLLIILIKLYLLVSIIFSNINIVISIKKFKKYLTSLTKSSMANKNIGKEHVFFRFYTIKLICKYRYRLLKYYRPSDIIFISNYFKRIMPILESSSLEIYNILWKFKFILHNNIT